MKRNALAVVLAVLIVALIGPTGCKNPYCPTTEEPYVIIDRPPPSDILPPVITFAWHSGLETDPRSVRYFVSQVVDTNGVYNSSFNIVKDMNENLWRYEEWWSDWKPYAAGNNAGRQTIIGDDETLDIDYSYIFAVQAMDRCGSVTETFTRDTNVRQFIVSRMAGPALTITEPYLGFYRFIGDDMPPVSVELPPGIPLNFSWVADASSYGGEIVCYRYGWDIQDLNDPSQWDTECNPFVTSAAERTFYSGVHVLYVEARDNAGSSTLGTVEITIVPFPMERNLLWVDDFYSIDFTQTIYVMPTETEHDTFWLDICSRAEGFVPGTDVFDTRNTAFQPPGLDKIGQYKNIIWTYSNDYETIAWDNVVRFVPESHVTIGVPRSVNYIPLFIAKGGHIMTLGRSDRGGGLAAVLNPWVQQFPISLNYEIAGLNAGDLSGVYSMPYKDYCVTMLDKISAVIRPDEEMPIRKIVDFDAMTYAYRDDNNPVTATYPELPEELRLWDVVTAPGAFWNPYFPNGPGGFTYVEIYDPEYWMDITAEVNQECFTPMYRMRSVSLLSALNHTTVALWLTKYENVVPDVASGIAVPARSVHFGFPLWFFDRTQVDQIADVIFDEWQINASP